MTRWTTLVVALALAVGVSLTLDRSAAQDDKTPSIKEIMKKAHKGPNALIGTIGKELKGAPVDWEHVHEHAEELLKLGKSLGKNDPPKGDKSSWEKLTKMYVETATALDKAVDKKDSKNAQAAQKKITTMCKSCHDAHRQ